MKLTVAIQPTQLSLVAVAEDIADGIVFGDAFAQASLASLNNNPNLTAIVNAVTGLADTLKVNISSVSVSISA